MKIIFLLLSIFFILNTNAQQKNKLQKIAIGFNPFALFEPNSTLDVGVIYPIKTQKKIFLNAGILLPFNFYKGELPFNKGGYRLIAQYRWYNKKDNFFWGFEARYRHVAFNNIGHSFMNKNLNDTVYLKNPNARANILAGAVLVGYQGYLTKNKKWGIEVSAGLGARNKVVSYKETTSTFIPIVYTDRRSWAPSKDESLGMVHLPCAIRLIYFIK